MGDCCWLSMDRPAQCNCSRAQQKDILVKKKKKKVHINYLKNYRKVLLK